MKISKAKTVIDGLTRINKLVQSGVIFWNTLILPMLTAIFVTYLLDANKNNSDVSILFWVLGGIVFLIHLFIVYVQYRGSVLDTMLVEYQEKEMALKSISDELNKLKDFHLTTTTYFLSQRHAIRFTVSSLSFAIGKIHNYVNDGHDLNVDEIKDMVHSLIWPLVVYREGLFSFRSGALWNIALYSPNQDGELVPVWRMNDKRISPRNRAWRPGFGVVGLSYLHKTIKYNSGMNDHVDNDASNLDKENYKSIIAVPMIPCESGSSEVEHESLGVLVITSSEANQFNLDRDATFLQNYATLIAILIEKIGSHSEHNYVSGAIGEGRN
ncbi:GAF domain-containing protein [Aeromonas caviae]|uniref:GAF domain-containing protein n=1 Tax=Aeromonas caviae TaxID=648 RepID=UPI0029D95220|nr:GAF domain-containing protein [Aeromonas caviae]MDX7873690.1 GAF domain-containing protein [Aeromonas caviae]